jgi:hypothetical protein
MPVTPMLAGAVATYLADELVRPTRSAEEAFYDVFRVVSTRSQIYDYCADFKQAIPRAIRRGSRSCTSATGGATTGRPWFRMPRPAGLTGR